MGCLISWRINRLAGFARGPLAAHGVRPPLFLEGVCAGATVGLWLFGWTVQISGLLGRRVGRSPGVGCQAGEL